MNKTKQILTTIITAIVISQPAMAGGKEDYSNLGCSGCHGPNGISHSPAFPNLAGQKSEYTVKQLKAYQSGSRVDATMNAMAGMTVGKEKSIADYLSSLK